VRDTRVGLLPPKLAQVLLTFGAWLTRNGAKAVPAHMTVFDPFCGTGVIPIECVLRRWNVLASDAAPKAITGTTKNLEWARKRFGVPKKEVTMTVFKHDARKPFPVAEKPGKGQYRLPNVVVTETSLGKIFTIYVKTALRRSFSLITIIVHTSMCHMTKHRSS
jgi:tRNA G37 N-methylase Trm5